MTLAALRYVKNNESLTFRDYLPFRRFRSLAFPKCGIIVSDHKKEPVNHWLSREGFTTECILNLLPLPLRSALRTHFGAAQAPDFEAPSLPAR